jgi:hypothetical protein
MMGRDSSPGIILSRMHNKKVQGKVIKSSLKRKDALSPAPIAAGETLTLVPVLLEQARTRMDSSSEATQLASERGGPIPSIATIAEETEREMNEIVSRVRQITQEWDEVDFAPGDTFLGSKSKNSLRASQSDVMSIVSEHESRSRETSKLLHSMSEHSPELSSYSEDESEDESEDGKISGASTLISDAAGDRKSLLSYHYRRVSKLAQEEIESAEQEKHATERSAASRIALLRQGTEVQAERNAHLAKEASEYQVRMKMSEAKAAGLNLRLLRESGGLRKKLEDACNVIVIQQRTIAMLEQDRRAAVQAENDPIAAGLVAEFLNQSKLRKSDLVVAGGLRKGSRSSLSEMEALRQQVEQLQIGNAELIERQKSAATVELQAIDREAGAQIAMLQEDVKSLALLRERESSTLLSRIAELEAGQNIATTSSSVDDIDLKSQVEEEKRGEVNQAPEVVESGPVQLMLEEAQAEVRRMRQALEDMELQNRKASEERVSLQNRVEASQKELTVQAEEVKDLHATLREAQAEAPERERAIMMLQTDLSNAEVKVSVMEIPASATDTKVAEDFNEIAAEIDGELSSLEEKVRCASMRIGKPPCVTFDAYGRAVESLQAMLSHPDRVREVMQHVKDLASESMHLYLKWASGEEKISALVDEVDAAKLRTADNRVISSQREAQSSAEILQLKEFISELQQTFQKTRAEIKQEPAAGDSHNSQSLSSTSAASSQKRNRRASTSALSSTRRRSSLALSSPVIAVAAPKSCLRCSASKAEAKRASSRADILQQQLEEAQAKSFSAAEKIGMLEREVANQTQMLALAHRVALNASAAIPSVTEATTGTGAPQPVFMSAKNSKEDAKELLRLMSQAKANRLKNVVRLSYIARSSKVAPRKRKKASVSSNLDCTAVTETNLDTAAAAFENCTETIKDQAPAAGSVCDISTEAIVQENLTIKTTSPHPEAQSQPLSVKRKVTDDSREKVLLSGPVADSGKDDATPSQPQMQHDEEADHQYDTAEVIPPLTRSTRQSQAMEQHSYDMQAEVIDSRRPSSSTSSCKNREDNACLHESADFLAEENPKLHTAERQHVADQVCKILDGPIPGEHQVTISTYLSDSPGKTDIVDVVNESPDPGIPQTSAKIDSAPASDNTVGIMDSASTESISGPLKSLSSEPEAESVLAHEHYPLALSHEVSAGGGPPAPALGCTEVKARHQDTSLKVELFTPLDETEVSNSPIPSNRGSSVNAADENLETVLVSENDLSVDLSAYDLNPKEQTLPGYTEAAARCAMVKDLIDHNLLQIRDLNQTTNAEYSVTLEKDLVSSREELSDCYIALQNAIQGYGVEPAAALRFAVHENLRRRTVFCAWRAEVLPARTEASNMIIDEQSSDDYAIRLLRFQVDVLAEAIAALGGWRAALFLETGGVNLDVDLQVWTPADQLLMLHAIVGRLRQELDDMNQQQEELYEDRERMTTWMQEELASERCVKDKLQSQLREAQESQVRKQTSHHKSDLFLRQDMAGCVAEGNSKGSRPYSLNLLHREHAMAIECRKRVVDLATEIVRTCRPDGGIVNCTARYPKLPQEGKILEGYQELGHMSPYASLSACSSTTTFVEDPLLSAESCCTQNVWDEQGSLDSLGTQQSTDSTSSAEICNLLSRQLRATSSHISSLYERHAEASSTNECEEVGSLICTGLSLDVGRLAKAVQAIQAYLKDMETAHHDEIDLKEREIAMLVNAYQRVTRQLEEVDWLGNGTTSGEEHQPQNATSSGAIEGCHFREIPLRFRSQKAINSRKERGDMGGDDSLKELEALLEEASKDRGVCSSLRFQIMEVWHFPRT